MCECFAHMYVCVHYAYLLPVEVRRGHQIIWNLSYRQCELPCECWESNPCPLQEPQVLSLFSALNFLSTLSSQVSTLVLPTVIAACVSELAGVLG